VALIFRSYTKSTYWIIPRNTDWSVQRSASTIGRSSVCRHKNPCIFTQIDVTCSEIKMQQPWRRQQSIQPCQIHNISRPTMRMRCWYYNVGTLGSCSQLLLPPPSANPEDFWPAFADDHGSGIRILSQPSRSQLRQWLFRLKLFNEMQQLQLVRVAWRFVATIVDPVTLMWLLALWGRCVKSIGFSICLSTNQRLT
jgi:hypothetical protein